MQEQFDELRKALNMSGPTDTGITSLVKPAPLRLPQPDDQQVSKSSGLFSSTLPVILDVLLSWEHTGEVCI